MKNNKQNLRLGILWADPYCGNLGVAALAYSTLILFEKVALRTGLRFDYTLWGASRCGHDTIDAGMQRITVRTVRSFMGGDWFAFLRNCLERPVRVGDAVVRIGLSAVRLGRRHGGRRQLFRYLRHHAFPQHGFYEVVGTPPA